MRYFLVALSIGVSASLPASAEIVRGGMDCTITEQLYQEIDRTGLQISDIRPNGDKIGAKLRLRYEFDRAAASLPWRLKTEFGRKAIYFDAKFPPSTLTIMEEDGQKRGFEAHSLSHQIKAEFTFTKIGLSTKDSTAIFVHNEDNRWSGIFTESRPKSGTQQAYYSLTMGFDCEHKTNVIEKLTALVK